MFSPRIRLVAARIVVYELQLAHEADSRVLSLDQVVAEQRVVGKAIANGAVKRLQIVEALCR